MSTTRASDRLKQPKAEGVGPATETAESAHAPLHLDVKVEERSACQRHVIVKVAREDVDRYFKDVLDDLVPKAALPGFRPGRAPRKLVEARFRDEVADQVKAKLLMDSLAQITDQKLFTAIGEPELDIDAVQVPDEGPLVFEFDIEVRPEFALPRWQGLTLDRIVHTFSDEEVEERLKKLLSRYGHLERHDGPIERGHVVTLTLRSSFEGRPLAQITEEPIEVRPVLSLRDAKLEGFDTLLVGRRAGETVRAKVTISPEAENEELRGKEVDLEMEIVAVERRTLPELTREFLDRIGGFSGPEELRQEVRREMERQFKFQQQRLIRQQITSLLTVTATWDLPQDLLRRQARRELERAVLDLRAHGFSEEDVRAHFNELSQNVMASTARALKEHFILERIAEEEKIEATPEDYDREIELLAEQADESPRRVRARLEKKGLMDTLRNQIIERKVIELIEKHAEFRDVPYQPQLKEEVAALDFAAAGTPASAIPQAQHDEGSSPLAAGKTPGGE
jgi:trigger factor